VKATDQRGPVGVGTGEDVEQLAGPLPHRRRRRSWRRCRCGRSRLGSLLTLTPMNDVITKSASSLFRWVWCGITSTIGHRRRHRTKCSNWNKYLCAAFDSRRRPVRRSGQETDASGGNLDASSVRDRMPSLR
jgi:hypothetical protein